MGRPRQFDEERALDAAMHLFWSQGYEATSTQDLCEATGLGRSSIYNTFRSKHDLYRRALDRYAQMTDGRLLEIMDGEGTGRDKIRGLLDDSVDSSVEGGRDGCFGVNSMVELGPRDEEVDGQLRRGVRWRVGIMRGVIEEGQRDGSIAADRDAKALADFVFTTIGGIRIQARSGAPREVLAGIADMAMFAF